VLGKISLKLWNKNKLPEFHGGEAGNKPRAPEFHIQKDETDLQKTETQVSLVSFQYIVALDPSAAFVTAGAQRVDNQMTSSAYPVIWPLRLTHSTAGTKS
jgi:hypothetical protein